MSGLKLKLKNKKLQDTFENFESSQDDQYSNRTTNERKPTVLNFPEQEPIEHDPHVERNEKLKVDLKYVKREEKKKKSSKYFYRVSNHHELFKIGRSFYSDYLSGVKSFAITSTGYQTSQQKSILGLASFFDHKEDVKIGIISDNLQQGAFKDIISICKKVNFDLFGLDHQFVINMDDLLGLANHDAVVDYDEVFDQVIDMYDVIFWDVPELHKIQLHAEQYFPVIMKFESISIIVAKALSKRSDIEEIKRFFLGYGINLKGLLLAEKTSQDEGCDSRDNYSDDKEKDKPWWKKGLFKS
jgi:hypothetical protein